MLKTAIATICITVVMFVLLGSAFYIHSKLTGEDRNTPKILKYFDEGDYKAIYISEGNILNNTVYYVNNKNGLIYTIKNGEFKEFKAGNGSDMTIEEWNEEYKMGGLS
jgi:hypothetical protein